MNVTLPCCGQCPEQCLAYHITQAAHNQPRHQQHGRVAQRHGVRKQQRRTGGASLHTIRIHYFEWYFKTFRSNGGPQRL